MDSKACKKNIIRGFLSGLTALLLLSCSGPSQPEPISQDDIAALESSLARIEDAWNEGDRTPYVEFHANSTMMIPNGQALTEVESIREMTMSNPESNVSFTPINTWGYGRLANLQGAYSMTSPDGAVLDSGKFFQAFEKSSDGNWVLTHVIWNSDLPAPEPCQEESESSEM